ncbi:MAG: ATP-binding protein [Halofilum sp. (in: g-proteobacteria)]|nr:ATP-binding protein [Halofilum sp. (in: g-proteobacteria)]
MAVRVIQRLATGFWPMFALFVLLLLSLYFLAHFAEAPERLRYLFAPLLFANILGVAFILLLVVVNLWNLVQQFRRRVAGTRLTARLIAMFVLLALVPATILFAFSIKFLTSSIDSWFDTRVEQALEDSLRLSKDSLSLYMRTVQRLTDRMGGSLDDVPGEEAVAVLSNLNIESTASELTLFSSSGQVLATSSDDPAQIVPSRPGSGVLLQVSQGQTYTGLDLVGQSGLHVRVVLPVGGRAPDGSGRVLQALYPVPDDLEALAGSVEQAVGHYRQLTFMRGPLKTSYIGTLTLLLFLSVLTAIWAAFYAARRIMLPIHNLAEGTRAVAEGNYATRLPPSGRDELGFLVQSFNEMTRRLSHARDQARNSRVQVESQRAYLEAVLERISTGVVTLDDRGILHTANEAASRILGMALSPRTGRTLAAIAAEHPRIEPFEQVVMPHVAQGGGEWQDEFELAGNGLARKMVVCRGARLPDREDLAGGWVVVFDDITALAQAQREAAWSEVARRLAHEIKNPLTPIQLSAERLRRKLLDRLEPDDAAVLDRSTWTIVQQVEALKSMVRAFADYAATPVADFVALDLNSVVREVVDLYAGNRGAAVELHAAEELPRVLADRARLRQLLHNLIKNAIEAQSGRDNPRVDVRTALIGASGEERVELAVSDAGPGIPAEMLDRLFEPYMSGKPRGSGLGLAIVKKIVEEHGGSVEAVNVAEGGASVRVRLPAMTAEQQRAANE